MDDQRNTAERRQGWNCGDNHTGHVERIAKLETRTDEVESQTDTLFGKFDKMSDTLNAIKMCVETLSNRQLSNHNELRNGIMALEGKLDVYEERFEERRVYADGIVEQARDKFEAVDERLRKIEGFAWFRDKITWVRDNLPWFVMYLILAALAGLVIFHSASERFLQIFFKVAK